MERKKGEQKKQFNYKDIEGFTPNVALYINKRQIINNKKYKQYEENLYFNDCDIDRNYCKWATKRRYYA